MSRGFIGEDFDNIIWIIVIVIIISAFLFDE